MSSLTNDNTVVLQRAGQSRGTLSACLVGGCRDCLRASGRSTSSAIVAQGARTVDWVWALSRRYGVYFAGALWTWGWRERRTGLLWLATATGLTLADLLTGYPDSRLASTVGLIAFWNFGSFELHFQLAYPTGRLDSVWARVFVIANYAASAVMTIPLLLFFNDQAPPYSYLGHGVSWLDSWNWWSTFLLVATTPILIALFVHRYARASRAARRSLGPFYFVVILANVTWMVFTSIALAQHASVYILGTYSFAAYGFAITFTAVLGLLGPAPRTWRGG